MPKEKIHNQFVLVEPRNSSPYVLNFFSTKEPITLEQVVSYMEKNEDMNWDRDSVTFVDKPENVEIN